jgi:hypothetical protein
VSSAIVFAAVEDKVFVRRIFGEPREGRRQQPGLVRTLWGR